MLTQSEADQFLQMVKRFVRAPASITIPLGADDTYEISSLDDRESFLLDVWRGTLRLSKLKFQNRVRTAIVLVRLDVDGAPHTNPNGEKVRERICTCSEKDMTTDGPIPWTQVSSLCLAMQGRHSKSSALSVRSNPLRLSRVSLYESGRVPEID